MANDSFLKKIADGLKDKAGDVVEALSDFTARIVGKEVTVYPSYGYRDRADPSVWVVPMRVWVHDNRDTPFVEDLIERWAVGHFEEDMKQPLKEEEKARLRACLENFIADDKSDEEAKFTFLDDPAGEVFRFEQRTTPNGVIEENVRIPDAKVRELLRRQEGGNHWVGVKVTAGGNDGVGEGHVRFLEPVGLSVVSDIDDTIKVTQVPAGKKTVLRNTFLREFKAAAGMREMYLGLKAEGFALTGDVSFHYVSGSPWQLYGLLSRFLMEQEQFPRGTFHMKNLRLNLLEPGALKSIKAFALGGDLATLDQKMRQITSLMVNLPQRKFILVGDSGEKDPEVYRAIQELFPQQVLKVYIRDVLGERLNGMERITGADVPVSLDTSEIVGEMKQFIAETAGAVRRSPTL